MSIRFKKILKGYKETPALRVALIFLISTSFFMLLQSSPTFLDPDSFYHIKVTQLMATQGIITDFPWLQFTTLTDIYIDHHLLYHLLLLPFVTLLPPIFGAKLATAILGSVFITLFFTLLRREEVRGAEAYTLLLLTNSPFVFRMMLTKASALSLIVLWIGIYLIFKKKYVWLFLVSALYVSVHGGFILLLIMAGLFVLADSIKKFWWGEDAYKNFLHRFPFFRLKARRFITTVFKKKNIILVAIVAGGMVVGLALSPYFPTNLLFLKEQLIQIGIFTDTTIRIGGEWYPYEISDFVRDNAIVLVVYILSLALFLATIKKQSDKSFFFYLSSLLLILYTFRSKRFIEYAVPFAVAASAYTVNAAWPIFKIELRRIKKQAPIIARTLLAISLLALTASFGILLKQNIDLYKTFQGGNKVDKFLEVSSWLEENTEPGEVIFHTDWSDFPILFYHNHHNYYIVGLDPTFMKNKDPELYELYAGITLGTKTMDIDQTISEVFNSQYFILNHGRETVERNLRQSGKFIKVYEGRDADIYKVK